MYDFDNICEIVERMKTATIKAEEAGYAILRILDQMDKIEQLMEEENNV